MSILVCKKVKVARGRISRGDTYQNKSVKSSVASVVRALPLVILLVLEYRTPLDDVPSVVHSIVDLLL